MLVKRILNIWVAFLTSQFILMGAIGILTYICMKSLGLPYALILSVIAGVCEAIPQIGPIIATVPAIAIALIKGSATLQIENWKFALIVLAIYILIQWFENWFIKPKIVGKMLDIHPIIALIGMTFFGIVFGVAGLLLSIPIMATIRELILFCFYNDTQTSHSSEDQL